jgi:hypothetical protein
VAYIASIHLGARLVSDYFCGPLSKECSEMVVDNFDKQASTSDAKWMVVWAWKGDRTEPGSSLAALQRLVAERNSGWNVVILGKEREEGISDLAGQGVKYITLEEVNETPFHTVKQMKQLEMQGIALNQQWKKNVGYLMALASGAHIIYDTDDEVTLSILPNQSFSAIPVRREFEPPFVGEAVTNTTVWNPLPSFGSCSSSSVLPRGYPLGSRRDKSSPLQSSEESGVEQDYLYFRIPGRAIAIQQSIMNDLENPSYEGEFHSRCRFHKGEAQWQPKALYPPAGTMSPYNSKATIHTYTALWGLVLPATLPDRLADIWRSYITQRLLWDAAGRVAFTMPWVDLSSESNEGDNIHHLRSGFSDEEQTWVAKLDNMVQFLLSWRSKELSFAKRILELYRALLSNGYIGEADFLLTQAWLQDLAEIGYRFPETFVEWDRPLGPPALGAFVVLVNSNLTKWCKQERETGFHLIFTNLPQTCANMAMSTKYPWLLFWMETEEGYFPEHKREQLRNACPGISLEFYPCDYRWPRSGGSWESHKYGTPQYQQMNYWLSFELYRHPALKRFKYISRIDEDAAVLSRSPLQQDFFELMEREKLRVVHLQPRMKECQCVLQELGPRAQKFVKSHQDQLNDNALALVSQFTRDPDLVAGWVEMYHLDVFQNNLYNEYLQHINYIEGIRKYGWREQSIKTIWMRIYVPAQQISPPWHQLEQGLTHKVPKCTKNIVTLLP